MHQTVRVALHVALGALVAWQAVAAAVQLVHRLAADAGADWHLRLCGDTTARVRSVLGDDASLLADVRRLVPPRSVVWNRQVHASLDELRRTARNEDELRATIDRLSARNGLFVQMTTLLFPDVLFCSVPDPIAQAESDGRSARVFVLDGDPEPTGRAGWTCEHRTERFRLWRFRKE